MEGFVIRFTNYKWSEWIRSPEIDSAIQSGIQGIGWFYLLCALLVLFVKPNWNKKITLTVLGIGIISLIILAALYCKEKFYHSGQFLEYSIQWSLPLFFYASLFYDWKSKTFEMALKVVIAATFLGHGLYALGFYPVPGNFVQMTLNVFPFLSENVSLIFTSFPFESIIVIVRSTLEPVSPKINSASPGRYSIFVVLMSISPEPICSPTVNTSVL